MKRLISLLLVLCLVVSMAPVSVFAATEDSQQEAQVSNDQVTFEGNNALGGLLAEELRDKQEEDAQAEEESGGYIVLDLAIEGSTATVSYETMEDAQLVVAIYTEDSSQLLCTGKLAVEAGSTDAVVEIEGTMPQYFMAQAFLLDNYDFSPLCKAYTTPMYTKAMQDLLASTAEDYDQDRVLTLSEDTSSNFVVYQDHVLVVRPQDDANVMRSSDDENRIYVIENATDAVMALETGDIFAYEATAYDVLVVKVGTITTDGTTVTVVGQDVELEEAFAFMKMEQTGDAGDLEADPTQKPEDGLTFEGVQQSGGVQGRAINGDVTLSSSIGFTLEKEVYNEHNRSIKLSGEYKLQLDMHLSFYLAWSYTFIEFKIDTKVTGAFAVTGEVKLNLDMGIYATNLFGVTVGFAPELQLKFTGKISLTLEFTSTIGFAYEKGTGMQSLCSSPKLKEPNFTFEGKVFFGIDLCPTVRFITATIAKLDISIPIGLELTGELYRNPHYENLEDYEGTIHHCETCLEMELDFVVSPKIVLNFLNCSFFKVEAELANIRIKIADLYYSLDSNVLDWGTCPNKSYRVTVATENATNKPVAGITVVYDVFKGDTDNVIGVTNENGAVCTYLKPDRYVFRAEIAGTTYQCHHDIDRAGKVILGPNVKDGRNFIAERLNPGDFLDAGRQIDRGTCGDNLTWVLYENGDLFISGMGKMTDFPHYFSAPWSTPYCNKIKRVIVDDGVTSIGTNAFYDYSDHHYSKLTEVILSEDVETIGDNAFYRCSELKTINFPAELTSIGNCAFAGCHSLEEVTIPSKVTTIGYDAFDSTYSLKTVYYNAVNANEGISNPSIFVRAGMESGGFDLIIDKKVQKIPNYLVAYYDDGTMSHVNYVKSITFEEGSQCTEIGDYAFYLCTTASEIVLPENLEFIGDYAFAYVTVPIPSIPDSVKTIGDYAFHEATGLQSGVLPSSLTSIGTCAFWGCTSIKQVDFNSTVAAIPQSAFRECTALETVQLFDGLESIGMYAFDSCTALKEISLPNTVTTISTEAFQYCTSLASVDLGKGLTSIGANAFEYCESLKSVVIPDTVTKLGKASFRYNTSLESFHLGKGVTSFTADILHYNQNLTTITVSSSNSTYRSINNCIIKKSGYPSKQIVAGCASSVIPTDGSATSIAEEAFRYCSGLTSISIPSKITSIYSNAFADCTSLQSVTFSGSSITLESGVFANCTALESIVVPKNSSYSGNKVPANLFRGCTALKDVTLSATTTAIGNYAFEGCASLKTITIPNTVTEIGSYAFQDCTGLETIVIPDSAKTLGNYSVFNGCSSLKNVTIGNSVTSIPTSTFADCTSLETINIPNNVTSLSQYAFSGCTALKTVTIGSGLTSLNHAVFNNCDNLVSVTFTGNKPSSFNSTSFMGVTCVVYYPADNSSWTSAITNNYGGTLTWVGYDPAAAGSSSGGSRSAKLAVYPGRQNSQQKDGQTVRTATFEGLVPGQEYVMLAMVSMTADDLLAADNILYIHQAAADENGMLVVEYVQRVTTGESYIMVCGASHENLNSALIQFPTMVADTQLHAVDPVVVYENQVLTEGEDYVISGVTDYTAAGEYTCYIRGIYDYTGTVPCTYAVIDAQGATADFGEKVYHNLRLQDLTKIGYAFTIQAPAAEQYGVLIWDNQVSGQVTVNTPGVQNKTLTYDRGFYTAESDGIYAQRLDTVYYAMPYVKIADQYIYGKVDVYSPLMYAQTILAGNDDALSQLMISLLNYGTYAQHYFAESSGQTTPETLINQGLTDRQKRIGWSDDLKVATPVPEKDTNQTLAVTWYGTNLNLLEAIQMNMAAIGSFSGMYCWTEEAYDQAQVLDSTTASGTATIRKDGSYTIGGITGIVAQGIFDVYYLSAYDANGNLGPVRADSVAAYATRLLESESTTEATKNLAKALLVYGNSAVAYFAQND